MDTYESKRSFCRTYLFDFLLFDGLSRLDDDDCQFRV